MNNESEMTGKDLKGILQSLKSDEWYYVKKKDS